MAKGSREGGGEGLVVVVGDLRPGGNAWRKEAGNALRLERRCSRRKVAEGRRGGDAGVNTPVISVKCTWTQLPKRYYCCYASPVPKARNKYRDEAKFANAFDTIWSCVVDRTNIILGCLWIQENNFRNRRVNFFNSTVGYFVWWRIAEDRKGKFRDTYYSMLRFSYEDFHVKGKKQNTQQFEHISPLSL